MKKFALSMMFLALTGCERGEYTDAPARQPFEVPPLPDFNQIQDVQEKKQAFYNYMLPLIHEANARILSERALVETWYLNPNSLTDDQQTELQLLLIKYRITHEDPDVQKDLLLRRVNALPPSLVLAQAANESAWGTSRFAREGNNLFGQWCFREGCGLIPESRGDRRHEVRAFETPLDSVESYMRNLNSHPRYHHLRDRRLQEITKRGYVSGISLTEGLQSYSERGEEYIAEIQQMIEFNQLHRFDGNTPHSDNQSSSEPAPGG